MNKNKIKLLSSLLIGIFLLSSVVQGNSLLTEVKLIIDETISINWNNEKFTPREDTGEAVHPLIYKGRTYLPVRFIAEKAGVDVGWDGTSRTVILNQDLNNAVNDNINRELEKQVESLIKENSNLKSQNKDNDYTKQIKELIQSIVDAKKIDTTGKTIESIQALDNTIAGAVAIRDNINATPQEVEKYIQSISNSIRGLTNKKQDNFKNKFFILRTKSSYDEKEANEMMDRILKVSPNILNSMYNKGIRMILCDGRITDEPELEHLKGITPRGWEGTGKTWDDIPGAGGNMRPIARIGHSHPSFESGHGAVNLELHELAHTIDNYLINTSSSSNFNNIWKSEVENILRDEYFISHRQEYFAETFAMYYLSNSTQKELMQKAPRTYEFIKNLDSYIETPKLRRGKENIMDLENIIIQEEMFN